MAVASWCFELITDEIAREGVQPVDIFEKLRAISISEAKTLVYMAEDMFAAEPLFKILPGGTITVVGDMHGDIAVALGIAREILHPKEENSKVVFLGDYVDRGKHQVDVINLVLALKVLRPGRVILLRGNHEIASINERDGFRDHLNQQFGMIDGKIMWHVYNRVFAQLPLAARTWNGAFLVHGGIPSKLDTLGSINRLPREVDPENEQVIELLWNDPVEKKVNGTSGFKKSPRGGGVKEFGETAFLSFLEKHQLSIVVRAHEKFPQGFKYFFNEKLVSIFSARNEASSPFQKQISPKIVMVSGNGEISIEPIDIPDIDVSI
nr:metallophosphoesterase [Candidatus Sigynarchaeota archaeon]